MSYKTGTIQCGIGIKQSHWIEEQLWMDFKYVLTRIGRFIGMNVAFLYLADSHVGICTVYMEKLAYTPALKKRALKIYRFSLIIYHLNFRVQLVMKNCSIICLLLVFYSIWKVLEPVVLRFWPRNRRNLNGHTYFIVVQNVDEWDNYVLSISEIKIPFLGTKIHEVNVHCNIKGGNYI